MKHRQHQRARSAGLARAMVANAARRITHINGGPHRTSTKHDHYSDFGWPEQLDFAQFYRMYCRNSLASAVVDKTIAKVWETDPELWESTKPASSDSEAEIKEHLLNIRLWQAFAEADRRSMVGRYGAVILRFADGKPFDEPVDRVPGGIEGLVGAIPCWESQLRPSMWDTDSRSPHYGEPTMFQFNEANITDVINAAPRQFAVHPDRVLIWSRDGTIHCHSDLESIYNDLIDAEKIKGAGGEGFWKNARAAPVIEAPDGMSADSLAQSMGVDVAGLREAINEQVDDFQGGFDKGLMLGGMAAKPMSISLTSPEHFFATNVNSIAAARMIPVRILMGSQTGERASTEDAKAWSLTCNSIRVNRAKPLIRAIALRLVKFGILPDRDWFVGWADLTESTGEEKIERAKKMSDINAATPIGDTAPFLPAEIRETAGFLIEDTDWVDDEITGEVIEP